MTHKTTFNFNEKYYFRGAKRGYDEIVNEKRKKKILDTV